MNLAGYISAINGWTSWQQSETKFSSEESKDNFSEPHYSSWSNYSRLNRACKQQEKEAAETVLIRIVVYWFLTITSF
jgi:hypothetical protein